MIALVAGPTTLVNVRSKADPLELDGFTMVIALFLWSAKPMRPRVSARTAGTVKLGRVGRDGRLVRTVFGLVVVGPVDVQLVFALVGTMLAMLRFVRVWVTSVAQLTIRLRVLTIGVYRRARDVGRRNRRGRRERRGRVVGFDVGRGRRNRDVVAPTSLSAWSECLVDYWVVARIPSDYWFVFYL